MNPENSDRYDDDYCDGDDFDDTVDELCADCNGTGRQRCTVDNDGGTISMECPECGGDGII